MPIAPLTQNTEETPAGPLTLRVYAGENCRGDLYQDDGKSFAFRSGQFLRRHFSCEVNSDGTLKSISALEKARFVPWWKQVRIEAFGWRSQSKQATSATGTYNLEQLGNSWIATIPETSASSIVTLH